MYVLSDNGVNGRAGGRASSCVSFFCLCSSERASESIITSASDLFFLLFDFVLVL